MFRPFSLAIFRLISRTHSTSYLPTVYNPQNPSVAAY